MLCPLPGCTGSLVRTTLLEHGFFLSRHSSRWVLSMGFIAGSWPSGEMARFFPALPKHGASPFLLR